MDLFVYLFPVFGHFTPTDWGITDDDEEIPRELYLELKWLSGIKAETRN
jgi:hypothetical protein